MDNNFETMKFQSPKDQSMTISQVLEAVCIALEKKGYDPKNQIIGYILSGDPTYITSYDNARNLIRKIDRDELVEELLTVYIENKIK